MTRSEIRALPLRRTRGLFTRILAALALAATRRRDRQLLARLDPHLLRDIGLTPDEARIEAAKPFWQP